MKYNIDDPNTIGQPTTNSRETTNGRSTPTDSLDSTARVENKPRPNDGTGEAGRSDLPTTEDETASDGEFHYQPTGSNWLENLWNELTGKAKRDYEEQYNNFLMHRDDESLDRNVEAYNRLGLNTSLLAGSTLNNTALTTPDFGKGNAQTALDLASSVAGLASGNVGMAMSFLKDRASLEGQKIDNMLKGYQVPRARFNASIDSLVEAKANNSGMVDGMASNQLLAQASKLRNEAESEQNEGMKLAHEYLALQLQAISDSDLSEVDKDGNKWFKKSVTDKATATNDIMTGMDEKEFSASEREYKKQKNRYDLDKAQHDKLFLELTDTWAKTNQAFRERYGEEQLKALQKSNALYDLIQNMDVSDKEKSILLLLSGSADDIAGTVSKFL